MQQPLMMAALKALHLLIEEMKRDIRDLRLEVQEMREEWAVEYSPPGSDTESEESFVSTQSAPPTISSA